MTITFSTPEENEQLKPRITVVGCGGAGGNAVNNMITQNLEGVEFVVANTDAQALSQSQSELRVQLGREITHGLGAGSRPDIGRAAAEEAMDDINQILNGSHMVFIAAGMGGGTGTGAAPVIAKLAREQGMLTVGVITKPFQFEGSNRMRIADAGIKEMQQFVDTLIVIPNQNLFRIANEKTTFADAFALADDVLYSGVRGVTDLMVVPGLINLDFNDIRSVMSEMGKAMMGTGEADGEDRARLAAEAAISNPLLDEVSMKGACGVLINITGGPDMTLFEVDEAANRIGEEVDSDANIIFGSALDQGLEGRIRVSVVATGIEVDGTLKNRPVLRVNNDTINTNTDVDSIQLSSASQSTQTTSTPFVPESLNKTAWRETDLVNQTYPKGSDLEKVKETNLEKEDTQVLVQPKMDNLEEAKEFSTNEISGPKAETPIEPVIPLNKMEHIESLLSEDEPFIPPLPAERANPAPERAKTEADPFREAEMLNASPTQEKKRSQTFLQRMTGSNWKRREDTKKQDTTITPEPTQMPKQDFGDNPAGQQQVEQKIVPKEPQPTPQAVQRHLTEEGLKTENDRSQKEEDLLDIPAFLRRQAN